MVRLELWNDRLREERERDRGREQQGGGGSGGRRVRRYSSSDAAISGSSPEDELADRTGTLTMGDQPERASSDTESDARNSRSIGR
jgi:hypothetical protein